AAVVTALSNFVADQIEEIYKLRPQVVNPGIDLETFNPYIKGGRVRSKYEVDDSPLLLTVSRLWPAKNLETALRSFRIVADNFQDAHYIIVGDGPCRPNLQDLTNRLGLTGRVRFISDAEVEVLAEYYAACDIFVFPALSEPWGLSLLEAMATGKPVVAADDGGPAEIVDHKVNGILVEPADPDSYAEAIIQLLKDRSTTRDMGERAAAKAKIYSWERMASAYSEIYESLL
ncbi:glycosyltransferase family 4 protein, partial [Candidatus Bathyarchaeota archaeon]|nr:glycosyltransferase family 4 protein [Candidatus Bathyarchaeota archaeon]